MEVYLIAGKRLLALAIAQLADLDVHVLPEHFRMRNRCGSTIFMCSFMFTRPMDTRPPRQPTRQSRRSWPWLEMSQSDGGSCERV